MNNELSNAERETHLNLSADDRSTWEVFSDDPVMMARLDKIAEVAVAVGGGKRYRLRADQVVLRTGKRRVSEAQRLQMVERLRNMRRATVAP